MTSENTNQSLPISAEVLGLSDVVVEDIKIDLAARKIRIRVKSTKEEILCRQCGRPTKPHGLGRPLTLRHLPILGKETYIEITPRRGRCSHCDDDPTTTQRLDWYDTNSKFTKPYEQHLLFELVNSTVADVSRKEGVDYHAVSDVIDKHVEEEIDFAKISALGIIGLDEISLKKGYQDYVTLVTYRISDEVKLLAVLKGRKKETVEAFLSKIPKRLKLTIKAVCCDLYDGYINAAKAALGNQIPVVADRFHVRKLYGKGLISFRKAELKRLKKKLTEAQYKSLKPAIALLRHQKDYFTADEKRLVEPLFKLAPELALAYQLSLELTSIFNTHATPTEARKQMEKWMERVTESSMKCFNKFMATLNNYIDIITNYFDGRHTSGFVEGFNNKVKVLKRRCYGLSNITRLFQRIILDTTGLQRFAPC